MQRTANPRTSVQFRPRPPSAWRRRQTCKTVSRGRAHRRRPLIRSSSAVEQPAVNRLVGGSNPSSGANGGGEVLETSPLFPFRPPGMLALRPRCGANAPHGFPTREVPMFVLRGTVYHFRRRVPVFLRGALGKSEIWLSLRTSSWRLAKARASALYVLTEKIFRGAEAMITEDGLVDSALFVAKYLQCVAEQIAGIGNWPPGDIGSQLEEIEENLVQLEQRFDSPESGTYRRRSGIQSGVSPARACPTAGCGVLDSDVRGTAAQCRRARRDGTRQIGTRGRNAGRPGRSRGGALAL